MTPTKNHPGPHRVAAIDPAKLYKLLLKSEKFVNWKPQSESDGVGSLRTAQMAEKHYAPDDLAELWGVSAETVRSIFREEPGVLRINSRSGSEKIMGTIGHSRHVVTAKSLKSLVKVHIHDKGGGPGLPASLFPLAGNPADLTEGGQPVVCWPSY